MLKVDGKKVTKNLEFNISPGSFKGRKVVISAHKTKHGIVAVAFKLSFKNIIKLILNKRIYLQQVPNGEKKYGINISVDPKEFEREVAENEEFFEKQELAKDEGKEVS